jgi:hypothetical protein
VRTSGRVAAPKGEVLTPPHGPKLSAHARIETIDAELRGAWLATLNGCPPSTVHIEEVLDEG